MAIPVFTQDQINKPVEIGRVSDLFPMPNTASNNKYAVNQYSYPIDLSSQDEYNGNMVVFYINVNKESKFNTQPNETIDMSNLDVPRVRGSLLGKEISSETAIGSGIVAGAGLASVLGILTKPALGIGIAALGATGLYQASKTAGTTTRAQKRLQTTIALHMPNNLNIKYGVGWAEEEMMGAEMLAQGVEDVSGLMKAVGDMKLSNMTTAAGFNKEFDKVASSKESQNSMSLLKAAALQNMPGGSYVGARSGLAPNPRKEMVFKSVDFRTFQFDYSFFPRSEEEAQHVLNIIYQFKFHMHPEFQDQTNFLYIYPSEFDIEYRTKNGENKYIHRHTSCVLTGLNINYTPNGQFTAFANGMPTRINVTMEFKELSIPTKADIERGL